MTRARSFTLIEMLVVIGIIALLTAIAVPVIFSVRERAKASATDAMFKDIGLRVETYANDYGQYPPCTYKSLEMKGNGKNDGSEILLRCLTTKSKNGPYLELKDEQMSNVDGDKLPPTNKNPTNSAFLTRDLHEITDAWGNPIAYLRNTEYDKGTVVVFPSGAVITVQAAKSEKTGQYQGPNSWQLWSAGPDEEYGTEDDIRAWGE